MYTSTNYQPPKYFVTPQTILASQNCEDPKNAEWLENAIELNSALISAAPEIRALADHLLPELIEAIETAGRIKKTNTPKNHSRLKHAFKIILLNCYAAYLMGLPVRYSRDSHYYSKPRRYGKLFFKYDRVCAIIDALKDQGYIQKSKWFYDREKNFGRQSRMWASEKLIDLFHKFLLINFQIVKRADRKETIELRDKEKDPIEYKETRFTRKARKNLCLYKDFINKNKVTIQLTQDTPASINNLCKRILSSALCGDIEITNLRVIKDRVLDSVNLYSQTQYHNNSYTLQEQYSPSMTHKFFSIDDTINELLYRKPYDFEPVIIASTATPSRLDGNICLAILSLITRKHLFYNRTQKGPTDIDRKELIKHRNAEKHPLHFYGIESIEFTVNAKNLHRVFNRCEKFKLGGRFYGGYHETIPKEFRKQIKINGQSVVEPDYSAHHLRMPYHLIEEDYQDDPYMALTKDENERKIYKRLCLIAINSEDESKAIKGFRKVALGEGFALGMTNEVIRSLLTRVKKVHHRIAKYIHSEKGRRLQNYDSQITEAILMSMTKQGIPCLPVHDSYIVPIQYEKELREAMKNEYKKLMGFYPVIG